MKTKYVVHPGWVKSQNDGDRHFIAYYQLIRLYKVNPYECVDAQRVEGRDTSNLIHLYPRRNGNYEVPNTSNAEG